jgi:hypothetical protein
VLVSANPVTGGNVSLLVVVDPLTVVALHDHQVLKDDPKPLGLPSVKVVVLNF